MSSLPKLETLPSNSGIGVLIGALLGLGLTYTATKTIAITRIIVTITRYLAFTHSHDNEIGLYSNKNLPFSYLDSY
jgi:hypothetical protein